MIFKIKELQHTIKSSNSQSNINQSNNPITKMLSSAPSLITSAPAMAVLLINPSSCLQVWMFYVLERWVVYMSTIGVFQQYVNNVQQTITQMALFAIAHERELLQGLDIILTAVRVGFMILAGYEMFRVSLELKQKQKQKSFSLNHFNRSREFKKQKQE
jgi:hypothetical protein